MAKTKIVKPSLATMLPVTAFFDKKAEAAVAKAADRMADLKFFEQVLARLKSGEDLSSEMAAFKRVDTKVAIETVKSLIAKCKSDLQAGYWEIKSKKIQTKVKSVLIEGELVPRYTVEYTIAVSGGEVNIKVETAGVTAEIYTNTKKCKGITEDVALDRVMQELVLSGMR